MYQKAKLSLKIKVSHTLASRDFVCRESPNHSRKRLTLLGVQPPIPREKGADTIREKIYEYP